MRKLKELNETVREYNGITARYKKDRSPENKALLDDVLERLKLQVNEVMVD